MQQQQQQQQWKNIRFTVRGREKLRRDLQRWKEILEIDDGEHAIERWSLVRRVKVVGYMPVLEKEEEKEKEGDVSSPDLDSDLDSDSDSNFDFRSPLQTLLANDDEDKNGIEDEDKKENDDRDDGHFCQPSRRLMEQFDGAPSPLLLTMHEEEKRQQNEAWLPFAQFLDHLPHLTDLIYACTNQIPICILASLHQNHPKSRLHLHTFSLRSLHQGKDDDASHDIDSDEWVLATSPCLASIVVPYSNYDTDELVNYNQDAVLHMVAAATAPRLKSVWMWHRIHGASLALQDAVRTSRPPFRGFFAARPSSDERSSELVNNKSKGGRLRELVLNGGGSTDSVQLIAWSNHAEFSALESLELRNQVRLDALQTLIQMAKRGGFKSLRILSLHLTPLPHQEQPHMDENISVLLQSLHPLEGLSLTGFVADQTFTTILNHHGATLRHLRFLPARQYRMQVNPFVISHHWLQKLQQKCLHLQELELLFPRTKGDQQEVTRYRALGTLPRLTRLSLLLDCSQLPLPNSTNDDYSFRGDDNEHEDKHEQKARCTREHLMNSALDSTLALAIFHAISSRSLQFLKLQVSEGSGGNVEGGWTDVDFSNIVRWIARSWICERIPGSGSGALGREQGEKIMFREIGKRERMQLKTTDVLEDDLAEYYDGKLYKRIWKELWPEERTGDWREDWSSFPLSTE